MPAVNDSYGPILPGETLTVGALYNLGTVPFTYSWPTPPATTSTVPVSSAAQLSSELASGSGKRIVVAAGTYVGAFAITQPDTWVDMQPGVSIYSTGFPEYSFQFTSSGPRAKISGGTCSRGFDCSGGWADVTIDGVDFQYQDTNSRQVNISEGWGDRMAILNSSFNLVVFNFYIGCFPGLNNPISNDPNAPGTEWFRNLIVCNCEFAADTAGPDPRSGFRINGVHKAIWRDCRIVSPNSNHIGRVEAWNDEWSFRNCQFEGVSSQGMNLSVDRPDTGYYGTITNIWYEDCEVYSTGGIFRLYRGTDGLQEHYDNINVSNFIWYSNAQSAGTAILPAPDDYYSVASIGSSISNSTYQPYQSPPSWP